MNKSTILAIVIFFSYFQLQAQSSKFKKIATDDPVVEQLSEAARKSISIQADFTQKKYLDFLEEEIISKGKFYFYKGKLKWAYQSPTKYIILIKNGEITISDDEKTTKYDVSSNKLFGILNDIMLHLIQGKFIEDDAFGIDFFQNEDQIKVILRPKMVYMANFLQEIHMFMNSSNALVSEIKMLEANGNYTSIYFSERILNEKISDEVFQIN